MGRALGFLKFVLLAVLGAGLVVLGLGNMAPVDLYLLPGKVAGPEPALKEVPLAAVVVASALIGMVIGQLMEWRREHKYRRSDRDRGRELARLRSELGRLKANTPDTDDDLPRVPAP